MIESNVMRYANQELPLYFEDRTGWFRVAVKENISIQLGTEIIVKGQDAPQLRKYNEWIMLEPCEQFFKRDCALIAKALDEPNDCVPVRLMNITDAVQIVRSGTTVAELSPVECVLTETIVFGKGQKFHDLDKELISLVERSSKHLPKDKTETVRSLINEYKDLLATSDQDLGRTNIVRHNINTGSNIPVKQPPRRTPIAMREKVDKHIDEILRMKVIEPANGPWSYGIVLVKKKNGSTRFCVDYRHLNDPTTKDAYPLHRIDDSLEQLSGNKTSAQDIGR